MAKAPRSGMMQTRVIDMAAFARLRGEQAGARKIARALTIPKSSAQALLSKKHWQQDPVKCRLFNQLRGASIDPETGIPSDDDLAKFGGLFGPNRYSSQPEKDMHTVMKAAGVRPEKRQEVVRRMTVVNGGEIQIPTRLDSATFAQMMEEKLYRALLMMDDTVIAAAGPRDLSTMIAMLTEKRQLLRGEPTAIVSVEQRGSLARLGRLILEEMKRRGEVVDAEPTAPKIDDEDEGGDGKD
jgi:hypothetical protein